MQHQKHQTQDQRLSLLIERCHQSPYTLKITDCYRSDYAVKCSYCQKKDGWYSWAFSGVAAMDSYLYQLMYLRGWYRCGKYHLKPNYRTNCCLTFVHRLDAPKFKPTKDQIKALILVSKLGYQSSSSLDQKIGKQFAKNEHQKPQLLKKKVKDVQIKEEDNKILQQICEELIPEIKTQLAISMQILGFSNQSVNTFSYQLHNQILFFVSKKGDSHDFYSNLILLILGKNKKILSTIEHSQKKLIQALQQFFSHQLCIKQFSIDMAKTGYILFKKLNLQKANQEIAVQSKLSLQQDSQMQSEQESCPLPMQLQQPKYKKSKRQKPNVKIICEQQVRPKIAELVMDHQTIRFAKITIKVTPAVFEEESYQIYKKYQANIHGQQQQKKPDSYKSFLCEQTIHYRKQYSPLKGLYSPTWNHQNRWQPPYQTDQKSAKTVGCYHMKYYYEGMLIAVGVVDILDHGLVSNYFFYDTDFKKYRLGVLSALIQIQYVRYINIKFPQFRYYFMGTYVPNNSKVQYKVNYMPCQLQCPQTYHFIQYSDGLRNKIQKILKGESPKRLSQEAAEILADMYFQGSSQTVKYLEQLKCLIDITGNPKSLNNLIKWNKQQIINILSQYVPAFGRKVTQLIKFKTNIAL